MTHPIVSPEAIRDINGIVDHITADSRSAADRLLDEIDQAFSLLAEMPGVGHRRPDLTTRRLLFWPIRRTYLIVYAVREPPIEIVRVLDGRRDVASLL